MNMKATKGLKLDEFSNYCSLHGIKYLSNKTQPYYDKVFWIVILLTSLTVSLHLVKLQLDKWDKELTEFSSGNNMDTAFNIPYPAVTICAPTNFSLSLILKSLRTINCSDDLLDIIFPPYYYSIHTSITIEMIDNTIDKLHHLYKTNVCNDNIKNGINEYKDFLKNLTYENQWPEEKYSDFINGFALPLYDQNRLNISCRFCSYIQKVVVMKRRICTTVNMESLQEILTDETKYDFRPSHIIKLPKSTWDIDKGYGEKGYEFLINKKFYPLSISSYKETITMRNLCLLTQGCIPSENVYLIAFHSPADIPNEFMDWLPVQTHNDYVLDVEPEIVYTENELQKWTPDKRGCRYSFENNLKLFKYYTEMNCIVECISNAYIEESGCVPSYLPRLKGTNICLQANLDVNLLLPSCECLPSCTEYKYKVKTRTERYRYDDTENRLFLDFKIKYKYYVRSLKYSLKDYLLTSFTILDTFLGLSMITFVEVGFFFVLIARRMFHIKNKRKTSPLKKVPQSEIELQSKNKPAISTSSLEPSNGTLQITSHPHQTSKEAENKGSESFFSKLKFSDYCSLHGIKYMTNRNNTVYDTLFWFAILLCGLGGSMHFLKDELYNWTVGLPIKVTTSNQEESVLKLPHPAITICSKSTLYRPAIKQSLKEGNFTENLELLDFLESYIQKDLSKLKRYFVYKLGNFSYDDDFTKLLDMAFERQIYNYYNYYYNKISAELKNFIDQDQSSYKDLSYVHESWSEEKYLNYIKRYVAPNDLSPLSAVCSNEYKGSCKTVELNKCVCSFSQNIMFGGNQCFTINMMNATDIVTEQTQIYSIESNNYYSEMNYSLRDLDNKYDWKFENPTLKKEENTLPSTNRLSTFKETVVIHGLPAEWGPNYNYIVALHRSTDIPNEFLEWYELRNSSNNAFSVDLKITYTKEELQQTSPDLRGCKYTYENNLTMFKFYTEMNCITECLSKIYIKEKGCVPFFYPRPRGTKICMKNDLEVSTIVPFCHCLPSCNDYLYIIEKIGTPNFEEKSRTKVSFLFKAKTNFNIRGLKYTWKDYTLTCLTILDTFLGLSLITVIELVFYLLSLGKILILTKFQQGVHVPKDEPEATTSKLNIGDQQSAELTERESALNSTIYKIKNTKFNFSFEEFTNYCSIHGLSYLSNRNLSRYEKLFWFTVLMSSLAGSVFLLKGELAYWSKGQIDVSPGKNGDSTNLPFPAFTVCQQEVFYDPALKNVFKMENLKHLLDRPIENYPDILTMNTLKESTKNRSLSEILDILDFIDSFSKPLNKETSEKLYTAYKIRNFTEQFVHKLEKEFKFLINFYFSAYLEGYINNIQYNLTDRLVYKKLDELDKNKRILDIIVKDLDSFYNSTADGINDLIHLIRYSRPFEESWSESKYLKFLNRFVTIQDAPSYYNAACSNKYSGECEDAMYFSYAVEFKHIFKHCTCSFIQNILMKGSRCFTLNMVDASEIFADQVKHEFFSNNNLNSISRNYTRWDVDKGYSWDMKDYVKLPKYIRDKEEYPNRMRSLKESIKVSPPRHWVHLILYKNLVYPTTYKFAIHSPADVPHEAMDWHELNRNSKNVIEIEPEVTYTEEGLRQLTPDQRGCRYSFENNLRFFKYYTEANCVVECMSINYIKERECVPIFLPRPNNTKICLVSDLKTEQYLHFCNCLPSCTDYNYKVVKKSSIFSRRERDISLNFKLKYKSFNRELKYTFFDYVISCVTIVDIFLGVSLITVVEMFFYFFVIIRKSIFRSIKSKRGTAQQNASLDFTLPQFEVTTNKPISTCSYSGKQSQQSITEPTSSEKSGQQSNKEGDVNISSNSPSASCSITLDHQTTTESSEIGTISQVSVSDKSDRITTVEQETTNLAHSSSVSSDSDENSARTINDFVNSRK